MPPEEAEVQGALRAEARGGQPWAGRLPEGLWTRPGIADTPDGKSHAVIWRAGVIADLGTLGSKESAAHAISPDGLVVGASDTASGDEHAFLWTDGEMINLGTLGGRESSAIDISARHLVYGMADTRAGTSRAAVWSGGTRIVLLGLGEGRCQAFGITNQGVAGGRAAGARVAAPVPLATPVAWP